jgi:hypothetical protein
MQIIFGTENAQNMAEKHIVLELDTMRFDPTQVVTTAYCVLQNLPMADLHLVVDNSELHHDMMEMYRDRRWAEAIEIISQIRDYWGEEMHSFYDAMTERMQSLIEHDPGADWDHVMTRAVTIAEADPA